MNRFFNFKDAVHTVLALGFCCLIALPLAYADDHRNNWYASGGANYALDTTIDFSVTNSPLADRAGQIDVSEDDWSYNIAIGREMGDVRLEVEALWVEYGIDDVMYTSISGYNHLLPFANETAVVEGSVNFKIFLANIYYDWDRGKKWVPYVGVGAGFAEVRMDSTLSLLGYHGSSLGQADEVATYQATAGLKYELSNNTSMYLDVRNLWIESVDFPQAGGSILNGGDSSYTELPMLRGGFTVRINNRDRRPHQPPYRRYRP